MNSPLENETLMSHLYSERDIRPRGLAYFLYGLKADISCTEYGVLTRLHVLEQNNPKQDSK